MTARLRIGVIGTGFGRRVVAPVFAATEGCEVVDVVSSRDAHAVLALCARRDLDLVSVHSPPFLHAEHVEEARETGRAVLCDKPFGRSLVDATRMVDVAAAAPELPALVNFEFRCDPVRIALRDVVHDGRIGEIRHVSWFQWSSGSRVPLRPFGWLFDRARGGGWIGAWGSHTVDFLRVLLGDVTGTRAQLRTDLPLRPDASGMEHECTAEDGFLAWLTFASGATAAVDSTFAAPRTLGARIAVQGTEGLVEQAGGRLTVRPVDGGEAGGGEEVVEVPGTEGDPHLVPMQRWAVTVRDVLRTGVVPAGVPTFADGLACVKVLDALRADGRPRGEGAR